MSLSSYGSAKRKISACSIGSSHLPSIFIFTGIAYGVVKESELLRDEDGHEIAYSEPVIYLVKTL